MSRLFFLWIVMGFTCIASAQKPVQIKIDPQKKIGAVNMRILGHNIEASDRRGIFSMPFDAPEDASRLGTCHGQGFWDPQAGLPVASVLKLSQDIRMSMLRYPGGCLAHRYDWKKTVGSVEDRPNWQFGLVEYLKLCQYIGAEPVITIPDYVGTPQDAADMVAFLNAPATVEYPWAMKRKALGHPQPFNVKWFELGNESSHGNHKIVPRKRFSASQYAQYFLKTAKAMREIDPTIQLGLVTVPGLDANDAWTTAVMKLAGKQADFMVLHFYAPGHGKFDLKDAQKLQRLNEACMAAPDQLEKYLADFRESSQKYCGKDLPIALTEFNIASGMMRSTGYSMSASVFLIDWLTKCLKPKNKVIMAQHWHLLNAFWGMVQTKKTEPLSPAYRAYRLLANHLGQDLIQSQVTSPKIEFAGLNKIHPARDKVLTSNQMVGQVDLKKMQMQKVNQPTLKGQLQNDGTGELVLTDFKANAYPLLLHLENINNQVADYQMQFEARFIDAKDAENLALGIAMQDARGYAVTGSGMVVGELALAKQWKVVEGTYHTLADSKAVDIIGHIVCGKLAKDKTISGKLEIRNFKINILSQRSFAAYDMVTTTATQSADGKKVYVVVVNKSLDQPTPLEISLNAKATSAASLYQLSPLASPSEQSCSDADGDPVLPSDDGIFRVTVPACSITGLTFRLGH